MINKIGSYTINKWDLWQIIFALFGTIMMGIMALLLIGTCSADMSEIEQFLSNDTTDQNEYLPWYTCGHFSRDLAKNASNHNISVGSVILGNHPVLRGYQNHIMNYIVSNGSIWVIEPQSDNIMRLNDTMYSYYRLYPNGPQVPTYWKHNFATEVII